MSGLPLKRGAAFVAVFLLCFAPARGTPPPPLDQYFTNLAGRFLVQQLGMRLDEVQVFPTNQYHAATHRVFQVAANICDAMNTNGFPLVFRPLFRTNDGAAFLSGFQRDNDRDTIGEWMASNPYGVPLVIAARKGFPNFNEFTTRTDTLVTRKLQLTRLTTNSLPARTNQMYILSLSNSVFVESWNSYAAEFNTPSQIEVTNIITITITNTGGVLFSNTAVAGVETNISAWQGRITQPGQGFKLPLITTVFPASNLVYSFEQNRFAPWATNQFEVIDGFPSPEWTLVVSNHLTYLHSVGANLIDCVILNDTSVQKLNHLLPQAPSPHTLVGTGVWDTNRIFGPGGPTEGIRAQIEVSRTTGTAQEWIDFMPVVGDRNRAVTNFLKFLLGSRDVPLVVETPFNPMVRITQIKTHQANDPLVHSHAGDLLAFPSNTVVKALRRTEEIWTIDNPRSATNYNKAYRPWTWHGYGISYGEPSSFDPAFIDPAVSSSDEWVFPTNETQRIEWLGRVHRGTPWQTIYLKSAVAETAMWRRHAGYGLHHPTNDWRLAAMLVSEWQTNHPAELHSINASSIEAWTAVMAGLTVWTNVEPFVDPLTSVDLLPFVVGPGDPQIAVVVDGINRTRGLQHGSYFNDVASWLGAPELSLKSPWLNTTDVHWMIIPDHAYEVLPSLLLAQMRADPVAQSVRIGDELRVRFSGCIPGDYAVETSADLTAWSRIAGLHTETNGAFEVALPISSGAAFFRAVLVHSAQ